MAIFDTKERDDILSAVVSFAQENEHIMALILVGSGARGYHDELSDIDMVIALDGDESMEAVMDYIASRLQERARLIYHKKVPQRRLQVFLTDRCLEIDIGYGAYTHAAAFKKHWKVLFDKTGTVDEAMRRSWERIEAASKADEIARKADACADTAWHSLMAAAAAIKRENPWRAAAEMDNARNLLIELLGARYALDTGRNRETDRLPEAERTALKATLPRDLSGEALWQSLNALTDAVYNELEHNETRAYIKVTRGQLHEYIAHCMTL